MLVRYSLTSMPFAYAGTISTFEITSAIQSANGVAHAMPEMPIVLLGSNINTMSMLPFRNNGRNNRCVFLPMA